MNYVFDTSALIWLTENPPVTSRWIGTIPVGATVYYHPVTLAEIAAQTHNEYVANRNPRRTPAQVADTVRARQALLVTLTLPPDRRPTSLRRRILPFDTGTKAAKNPRKTAYEQLSFEKQERRHLYRVASGQILVLASMVDHLILAVASFLRADGVSFAGFVTRDKQLFHAAKRIGLPSIYPPGPVEPSLDGTWLQP